MTEFVFEDGEQVQPERERKALDADTMEAWNYLLEVVGDYERYIGQIGDLGLTAPNLLYYRDEIQDMLDEFAMDDRVETREIWARIRGLDILLRARQVELVREVGHANFKQYQIMNDPARTRWWWFLNRVVPAPPPPSTRHFWEFWKPAEKTPEDEPESDQSPEKFSLDG
jgi:hypothetical protein